ncbi:unnamed protein product [Brassicogethes aeneus]|uniref:DUF4817 domain-containing protein n=1 Tax=Brassicogethes aeneus TaxID=1431903 RepID=A0A9P0B331_BRAAE|nr:unnamed protein product [Brassicogethes aeneus]
MDFLTVEEKIEMILIYGEAGRNLDDAVNNYAQRFPDKIRSRTSFHRSRAVYYKRECSTEKKEFVEQQSQRVASLTVFPTSPSANYIVPMIECTSL